MQRWRRADACGSLMMKFTRYVRPLHLFTLLFSRETGNAALRLSAVVGSSFPTVEIAMFKPRKAPFKEMVVEHPSTCTTRPDTVEHLPLFVACTSIVYTLGVGKKKIQQNTASLPEWRTFGSFS
jgi:hypothetical protein